MAIDKFIVDAIELIIDTVGIDKLLGLLFAKTGKERAQAILDAEFATADALADKAEAEKLGE